MPLSTIASYISTANEFVTHWTAANTAYGSSIQLAGGFKVGDLTTAKTDLQTAITAVEGPRNDVQNAAEDRDLKKAALLERLRQFRNAVTGLMAGSNYTTSPPTIPDFQASEGVIMRAMDDMQTLWVQINTTPPVGFTPPLKLVGAYAAATHLTDVTALRTTYATWNAALQTVELKLGARDALLPNIRNRLVQYRKAIQGLFAAGDPMILSLPRLTPAPGSTPKPVAFSAAWNPVTEEVDFAWTASTDAELDHYEIRDCDPPKYTAGSASVLMSISPPATSASDGTTLLVSGAAKVFRLFVVTHDANEKGSKTELVARP